MRAAHNGFVGQSGVQAHSAGEYFPVLSYWIGSSDRRVAEFQGVRRESDNRDDHDADLRRMKRAERIADAIYADPSGGSDLIDGDGWTGLPAHGYCAAYAGYERRIKGLNGAYGTVYAAIVELLESIDGIDSAGRPIGVGWWTRNGVTYLDVSTVFFDRDEALGFAEENDQIAIYDIVNGEDIDIRRV